MTLRYLVALLLFTYGSVMASEAKTIEIAQSYKIHSKTLNESREYYVSLPKSYDETSNKYPVLVLLDAEQNMSHVVSTAQNLAQWRGIPEIIIVGITSVDRTRDYTPSQDIGYSERSGHGKQFMQFIKQELIPIIDKQFRTHPYRILEGHSLGGLFTSAEFLSSSRFFNAFIIAAPSLWWNDFETIKRAENMKTLEQQFETTAYFGIGEYDGDGMKNELDQFVTALRQNGHQNLRLGHKVHPGEGHMSAPLLINYEGLLHIFSDLQFSRSQWESFSTDDFISFENNLKEKYGTTAIQTAETYVLLARYLENKNDFDGAVAVLKSNLVAYPGYGPNHELLANAYALNGDTDKAIEQYKLAYSLTLDSKTGAGNADKYLDQIKLLENPVATTMSELRALSGCYSDGDKHLLFTQLESKLVGSHKNLGSFVLFPTEKQTFFMRKQPQYRYKFITGGNDKKVLLDAFGTTYEFSRQTGSNHCKNL